MTRRLNATALAERRYEVAKMNREGMTLAEIGEKLGVDASTVCRDMAWVREEWRKSVVENYDQARAVELAKLNYVERCCWDAWEGRGHVRGVQSRHSGRKPKRFAFLCRDRGLVKPLSGK